MGTSDPLIIRHCLNEEWWGKSHESPQVNKVCPMGPIFGAPGWPITTAYLDSALIPLAVFAWYGTDLFHIAGGLSGRHDRGFQDAFAQRRGLEHRCATPPVLP